MKTVSPPGIDTRGIVDLAGKGVVPPHGTGLWRCSEQRDGDSG